MNRRVVLVLMTVTALALGSRAAERSGAAGPLTVEVTSTGDATGSGAACPDAAKCTLRKAIETVNAETSADPYTITFRGATFPASTPATIAVTGSPLPAISRQKVTIDGSGAGVIVDGSAVGGTSDGLRLTGATAAVRGLRVRMFGGACLAVSGAGSTVGGDSGTGQGNRLGDCAIGLRLAGQAMTVRGNAIGFAPGSGEAAPVVTGILVTARDSEVGGESIPAAQANVIGNATVGVRVGDGQPPDFTGVVVARNVIGRTPGGSAAPVGVGVVLGQRSAGTRVVRNVIANTATAGIQVLADASGVPVTQNTLSGNVFSEIGGHSIDLGADGLRNGNDPGDGDSGANDLLNHPVLSRATQQRVEGSAGAGCGGCKIELYLAVVAGDREYGGAPVPIALATADGGGAFAFDLPPVTPGQWLTALATDASGNTSEFGPRVRVGAGVIQCGNVELQPGWNLVGYFDTTAALTARVPGDDRGRIRAVYHLDPGTLGYRRWLRDTTVGQTLSTLETGEAYWFLVDEPVALAAGFTLTVPLPAPLKAGWNTFVYFGGTAGVRDALSSIEGKYSEVYRYRPGANEGWDVWGNAATPAWARGFAEIEACGTYFVKLTEDATLLPLQP
ncbi:MAG: hypothetical protein ACKVT1_02325 [Dehalococcoidia bacterium]